MKLLIVLLSLPLFFSPTLLGQEAIFLKNPSFEDMPKYGTLPGGWRNCAFNNESPPDIHPVENGVFGVKQQPLDGNSFIGLVTRDNFTTESIGQQLLTPLKGGQCYSLSLTLSRADRLMSVSRLTGEVANFNHPVALWIWGGLSPCGKKVQLAVSPDVDHTDWKKYTFQFQPEEDLSWLSFEAYYTEGTLDAYNGNLLVDNASAIIPISCDDKEALIDEAELAPPPYNYVNYVVPKDVSTKSFFSAHGGSGYYMDFRVVNRPNDINGLIIDNCPDIGFQFSSHLFKDEYGLALKEIAVNVQRQKNVIFLLGMPYVGSVLVNKRKKTIKRIFREIGLSKSKYRIVVLPPDWNEEGWMCGGQELWMKLKKRKLNN